MTDSSSKVGRLAWIVALVLGGGTLLLAWDRFGFGGDAALAGGQGFIDEIAQNPSQWALADATDPMTDEQIISANRQFEIDGFLIDASIACRPSSGTITYTFTTFNADATTPADFVVQLAGSSRIVALHEAEFRADSAAARKLQNGDPRYSNIFEVKDSEFQKLGSAQRLTVKLHLQQGEPVVRIEQTDPVVNNVLGRCAKAATAIEEQRQAEAARPREPQTHTFTITASFRINDSRNQAMWDSYVETVAGLCVGDKLVVKNDAAEPLGLMAGIYKSDNIIDIGSSSPGASATLDAPEEGEFIITSPEHETVRMRYRVSDCTK